MIMMTMTILLLVCSFLSYDSLIMVADCDRTRLMRGMFDNDDDDALNRGLAAVDI